MSWIKRPSPRVPVQPSHGWQAPHELVDDYAKRGVEIAKLNGILIQTEHMLNASRAEIRNLNAHVLDLHGRIERQADIFEEYRIEIEALRRRNTELEQKVVGMSSAGGDGWDDVVSAGLGKPAVPVLLPGQRADLGDIEQEKRYHDGLGDQ